MEKCIVDIFYAVSQVKKEYFRALAHRSNNSDYEQSTEQSFTAELFHRFKSIMEESDNNDYYNNLILHFDINKQSVNSRPDMVLHESQRNRNVQKLYVEVKTNSTVSLVGDFHKLITATNNQNENNLKFENAVMIVVNRNIDELLSSILTYDDFKQLPETQKNKIYFISVFEGKDNVKYDLLQLNLLIK